MTLRRNQLSCSEKENDRPVVCRTSEPWTGDDSMWGCEAVLQFQVFSALEVLQYLCLFVLGTMKRADQKFYSHNTLKNVALEWVRVPSRHQCRRRCWHCCKFLCCHKRPGQGQTDSELGGSALFGCFVQRFD